jgi:hypothetical protein
MRIESSTQGWFHHLAAIQKLEEKILVLNFQRRDRFRIDIKRLLYTDSQRFSVVTDSVCFRLAAAKRDQIVRWSKES